jgi:hypothetical protein
VDRGASLRVVKLVRIEVSAARVVTQHASAVDRRENGQVGHHQCYFRALTRFQGLPKEALGVFGVHQRQLGEVRPLHLVVRPQRFELLGRMGFGEREGHHAKNLVSHQGLLGLIEEDGVVGHGVSLMVCPRYWLGLVSA